MLCLVTLLLFESLGLSVWVASSKRKRSALLNDSVVPSYSLIAVDPPQYKEDINFSQDCIDEDETVRDNEAAPGKQSHISILNSLISLDRHQSHKMMLAKIARRHKFQNVCAPPDDDLDVDGIFFKEKCVCHFE